MINDTKRYTLEFIFQQNNFEISIVTDHCFFASNDEEARLKSMALDRDFSDVFNMYYSLEDSKVIMNILPNELFKRCCITNYAYYERTNMKLHKNLDENRFDELITEHLINQKEKGRIDFYSCAYSIKELSYYIN